MIRVIFGTQNFALITNANDPGGILILEVKNKDYSLAQAAQIVESENAKILSSYIHSNGSNVTLDLVLKINLECIMKTNGIL